MDEEVLAWISTGYTGSAQNIGLRPQRHIIRQIADGFQIAVTITVQKRTIRAISLNGLRKGKKMVLGKGHKVKRK